MKTIAVFATIVYAPSQNSRTTVLDKSKENPKVIQGKSPLIADYTVIFAVFC